MHFIGSRFRLEFRGVCYRCWVRASLSCRDHEGGGGAKFQQWDGKQWAVITDWIAPDQTLVRPLVEASAAKYAQDQGITLRDCP